MTPVALIILDGFGIGKPHLGNAIYRAHAPTFEYLNKNAFVGSLQASGTAVGLPWGEAGNSEVGHLTIGAGQIIYQYMPRISMAVRDGSFFTNWALEGAVKYVKAQNSTLHLMGLVSSGTVHAYIDHVYALLELAKRNGIENVALHVFTDGKDAPVPHEALTFLPKVQEHLREIGVGRIASIIGRHFSMDRDQNWDRIEKAYRLLTLGEGMPITDIPAYIQAQYDQGLTDDKLEPAVVPQKDGTPERIRDNDAVIFFNFREDSARELTHAFVDEPFEHFSRTKPNLRFVTMTEYEKGLSARAAFQPPQVNATLGQAVAGAGLKQLRVAETEKYAHITYFLDGAKDVTYKDEKKVLIPSQNVGSTDDHPQMRAPEIAATIVDALTKGDFSLIAVNFANADMVGHTGNIEAAIRAIEFLDAALNQVLRAITIHNYALMITADHGNAEQKMDPISGRLLSKHSTNPVPFYAIGGGIEGGNWQGPLYELEPNGFLSDVAPTVLRVMGVEVPKEMTGRNLLE